jgi:two-component system sensor histidine kinase/response regulator
LTADKYQVIWLIDGYLSTRKIQVLEPDLVILDHQLIDTFQISQNLKKSIKMKHIKTLLFHESTISLNWKSLAAAGVDDYLIKPIQPYLLLEKVRYLLSLD